MHQDVLPFDYARLFVLSFDVDCNPKICNSFWNNLL
jgi:hypothetical protein